MRIILDTNLWISFLISRNYEKLDQLLISGECELVFSQELYEEFIAVVKRPKLRRYFAISDVEDLLEIIEDYAEYIVVTSEVSLCRDPKDNFLLSLSLDGNADYLLTGDNDLLVLKKIGKTQIMKIADFLDLKSL
ncbi:MAG: putative toxin-antitoxin system toxin component, PIN family [Balneolales bacterium]